MKITILPLFIVACGGSSMTDPDATPINDGNPITDGPIADGPPSPVGLVEMPLDCVAYTRDVHNAATDNSHDITINSFATVQLAPGADFVLSKCDAPVVPVCGGGDICAGELEPSASKICDVGRGSARFYDGTLTILCGTRTERYLASGTLQSFTQTTFTVKLEVFQ